MKYKLNTFSAAVALSLGCSAAPAEIHIYSAIPLIGTEEVPAVVTDSYGAITAIYDDTNNVLYYGFEWQLAENSEATGAHFHGPAARGGNAGVRINLGTVSGNSGMKKDMVILSESEETELLAGHWYINIHTNSTPSGELRAQMVELSPVDTTVVYLLNEEKLRMESVIVPGAGVYDVEMEAIQGREPLSLELTGAEFKNLDSSSSTAEN